MTVRHLLRNGIRLVCHVHGGGPDLVLLHGFACSSHDWRTVAGPLARKYRVWMVDFRGHGESDAPGNAFTLADLVADLGHMAHELGWRRPVLAGHSLGGMVAVAYALKNPDAARALILVEGHTHLATTAAHIGGDVVTPRTNRQTAQHIRHEMEQGRRKLPPSLMQSLQAFDVRAQTRGLAMPVLCLWGDRYGMVTPAGFDAFAAAAGLHGHARIAPVLIPGSAHFIQLEQPDLLLEQIHAFLDRLPPAPPATGGA